MLGGRGWAPQTSRATGIGVHIMEETIFFFFYDKNRPERYPIRLAKWYTYQNVIKTK
jgi:hypothetical protein